MNLTDGVIYLHPLEQPDASDHLAGEDDEMAKWLSGGRSSIHTVRNYIARCQEHWRNGGALHAFGIFDSTTRQLIGSIEANFDASGLEPGQVNVSFGVFAKWRGQGIALRALDLICSYLKTTTQARQVVLKADCRNSRSIRVAEKSQFCSIGIFEEPDGCRMSRYVLNLIEPRPKGAVNYHQ